RAGGFASRDRGRFGPRRQRRLLCGVGGRVLRGRMLLRLLRMPLRKGSRSRRGTPVVLAGRAGEGAWPSDAPSAGELAAKVRAEGARLYRDLPWRNLDDPYAVLVSEVMLQQTQ